VRTPLLRTRAFFAILFLSASSAYTVQDPSKSPDVQKDRIWAKKSGLPERMVRQMRVRAGVDDGSNEHIDLLDAKSLSHRKQVLLVTAGGNGHCLGLFVFQKHAPYDMVWFTDGLSGGAGICRESPINPKAFVSAGRIVIQVPVFDYKRNVSKGSNVYVFEWNGKTYLQTRS
jgi:hypothetical protein